ncbi:MAG: Permease, partial [uncultured bacterium (gcode 4)]
MKVPYIMKLIFNKFFFQKFFAIGLLILLAYYLQQFFILFLITFLFAYLFLNLWEFLSDFLYKHIDKIHSRRWKNFLKAVFSVNSLVLSLYILFIWLIVFAISDIIPQIIWELSNLPKSMPFLEDQVKTVLIKLEELKNFKQDIQWTIKDLFTQSNYEIVMKFLWNLKSVGLILVEFIISLILSYVFIIDRNKIKKYLEDIKKWNFAFLYNEYEVIFGKIANWFWMIFKAQSIISFVNTILTILWLYIISFVHGWDSFPYIFTLAILVFIFGFIPVLWLFLSSIPILAIGFSYGWLTIVFEIILMITIIHMVEAYYLNPRIVSSYMELPISLTFLVLIISEQLFWLIWMLIWMPIFYIVIDALKDFDQYISKIKWAYSKVSEVKKETQNSITSGIRLSRS